MQQLDYAVDAASMAVARSLVPRRRFAFAAGVLATGSLCW